MSFSKVCVIGDELAVNLSDGHEMYLSLPILRRACPCALCQGEPDALGRVIRPKVEYGQGAFELVKLELIGSYGLQLFWADLHSSGIYSIDYLKKLEAFA